MLAKLYNSVQQVEYYHRSDILDAAVKGIKTLPKYFNEYKRFCIAE